MKTGKFNKYLALLKQVKILTKKKIMKDVSLITNINICIVILFN